jgi:hypothetical protein
VLVARGQNRKMATYRYYLARKLGGISPPISELHTIEAESPQEAARKLLQEGRLPQNVKQFWAHVLVWASEDGAQRGFESIRLADVLNESEASRQARPSSDVRFAAGGTESICDSEKSAAA